MSRGQKAGNPWRCILAAAVLVAAAAGSHAHAQAVGGRILGQVIADGGEQPLAGVVVRLGAAATETDDQGMFELAGIPPGRRTLRLSRLGYGERSVEVEVQEGRVSRIRLTLSETAITLTPLTVEAMSPDTLRARGAGFGRGVVTREQFAQWEASNMSFGDVLRTAIPSVRVRRLERVVGSDVCIELRTIRAMNNDCLAPAVYLDGVPITNPTMLFASLDIVMVESVEIVPAAEAGVRYGSGALYGAMLIETRRPGAGRRGRADPTRRVNYDWSQDPEGHSTALVLLASTLGNAAGLAVGVTAANECIGLRQPANDAIISHCSLLPTLGTGIAAIALPALGSGFGARLAGQTRDSRGLLAPASIASAMVTLPGYALTMSGRRNQSDGMEWVGRALIIAGAPLASTLADYLFRGLR